MAEERKPFLIAGLGLAGFAAYQLLQKPKPAPAPTCPSGYHLEGGLCVQDPAPPPPPPPPAAGFRVTATAGLIVRTGPGTGYASRGLLPYGTVVQIACQTVGTRVMNSSIWDRLSGPIAGYVSDWYVSTPAVGQYSPGLVVCAGSPPPPPPPPPGGGTLPPTGKPALASQTQLLPRMIVSTGCSWSDADYVVLHRRATATGSPVWGRVWIRDKYTWDGLAAPRSAVQVITPGLLGQIRDVGMIFRSIVRNYGIGWTWEGKNCGDCYELDMVQAPGINRGGPVVLKTAGGWC